MVEAILKIGKLRPQSKILICAPSNSAVNVLFQRLSEKLSSMEMFRYVAYQRNPKEISDLSVCLCVKQFVIIY